MLDFFQQNLQPLYFSPSKEEHKGLMKEAY